MIATTTVIPEVAETLCDTAPFKFLPACLVGGDKVVGAAATAVEFGSNPLGYIAQQMQFTAAGLAQEVLGGLQDITHPDLGVEWFTNSYAVSFGVAIFVLAILLGIQMAQLARRQVSGEEVASTLSFYVPAFFFGSLFGPMVGTLLVAMTGALGESLTEWGITSNAGMTTEMLVRAIGSGSDVVTAFGAFTAIIIYACMIVALLLTFLVLLVILVTLYLTGVLIPLSLVWLTSPTQRRRGMTLVTVWLGLNFSHVLIFFLLAVAFRMVNGLTINSQGAGLKGLADLAVATIALLMATLSPFTLMKFGNAVMPSNGPHSGGRPSLPSLPSPMPLLNQLAHDSKDSQTAKNSRSSPSPTESTPSSGQERSPSGNSSSGPGDGPSLTDRVKSRPSGSKVSGIEAGEISPLGSGSTSGTPGGGLSLAKAAPKAGPAAASGGGAGGGAGAAVEGATAAETAGAAASATGIGALVGVPLIAAGMAASAAGNVAKFAGELADTATEVTTDQMRYGDDDGQGEPRPHRKG